MKYKKFIFDIDKYYFFYYFSIFSSIIAVGNLLLYIMKAYNKLITKFI